MLKIKFKQYGIFKKYLTLNINISSKFFFNNDIGRVSTNTLKNKITENQNNKLPETKIRTLNDRRSKNFLKEDEESFRQKQQFLDKENSKPGNNKTEVQSDQEKDSDDDSFLNYNSVNNKNSDLNPKKIENSSKENKIKETNKVEIEKNFKSNNLFFLNIILALISDTYKSSIFLNKLSPKELDEYCLIFIQNIFAKNSKPENVINLIAEAFDNNYKNIPLNIDEKLSVAKKIFESLLIIYEFVDRGMKGFLSGDLSYQLIKISKEIIEKYLNELEEFEKNFINLGLDPKDFYDSFFKIDKKFYLNNSTKNISFNYDIESKDALHPNNVYVVNLKITQFFDTVQKKINIKDKVNVKFEDVKNIIDKEKHKFHNLFNDMYNNIFEATVTNKLKTPYHGILYPEKENMHNLFRRQLILEDHAYESSLKKFKENFLKLTE